MLLETNNNNTMQT